MGGPRGGLLSKAALGGRCEGGDIRLSAAEVYDTGTQQICGARHATVHGADEHGGLLCMCIIYIYIYII